MELKYQKTPMNTSKIGFYLMTLASDLLERRYQYQLGRTESFELAFQLTPQ